MTKVRIRINLEKWGGTGEAPEQFIERMNANITAIEKNGLRMYTDLAQKETNPNQKEYWQEQVEYITRKIKRYRKEICKAEAEIAKN